MSAMGSLGYSALFDTVYRRMFMLYMKEVARTETTTSTVSPEKATTFAALVRDRLINTLSRMLGSNDVEELLRRVVPMFEAKVAADLIVVLAERDWDRAAAGVGWSMEMVSVAQVLYVVALVAGAFSEGAMSIGVLVKELISGLQAGIEAVVEDVERKQFEEARKTAALENLARDRDQSMMVSTKFKGMFTTWVRARINSVAAGYIDARASARGVPGSEEGEVEMEIEGEGEDGSMGGAGRGDEGQAMGQALASELEASLMQRVTGAPGNSLDRLVESMRWEVQVRLGNRKEKEASTQSSLFSTLRGIVLGAQHEGLLDGLTIIQADVLAYCPLCSTASYAIKSLYFSPAFELVEGGGKGVNPSNFNVHHLRACVMSHLTRKSLSDDEEELLKALAAIDGVAEIVSATSRATHTLPTGDEVDVGTLAKSLGTRVQLLTELYQRTVEDLRVRTLEALGADPRAFSTFPRRFWNEAKTFAAVAASKHGPGSVVSMRDAMLTSLPSRRTTQRFIKEQAVALGATIMHPAMPFDPSASASFFVGLLAKLCPDVNPAEYSWMCSIDEMFIRFGLDVCSPPALLGDGGRVDEEDEGEEDGRQQMDDMAFGIVGFVSGASTALAARAVVPAVAPATEVVPTVATVEAHVVPAVVAGQEPTHEHQRSSREAMIMRSDTDVRRAFAAILKDSSHVADRATVVMMFPASSSELNIPPIPVGLLLTHGADRGVDTSTWVTSVRNAMGGVGIRMSGVGTDHASGSRLMHRHVVHPALVACTAAVTFVLYPLVEFAQPLFPQLLDSMGDEREMVDVVTSTVVDDVVARATAMAQDLETFLPAYDVVHWIVKYVGAFHGPRQFRVGDGAFCRATLVTVVGAARAAAYYETEEIESILSPSNVPAFFALTDGERSALHARVPWVVSQISSNDLTARDVSNADRALRHVSLSTACAVVRANAEHHISGDTYLALMVYLTVGRRAVLAQTSPVATYGLLLRIRDLSACTAVLRALQLDREHRSDDGAAGQTVHTWQVLSGLEKNHARLVQQTLIGAHLAIGRSRSRHQLDDATLVELVVEQTATATSQPNEELHGRVRTRGGRGTNISDATPLDVFNTIVSDLILTMKKEPIKAARAHHTRTHVSDGGILCATSVGPTFTITGTSATSLFRDATVQVTGALWSGWRRGFRSIPALAENWNLSGDNRVFVSAAGFDVVGVVSLLEREGRIPASLRHLRKAHDYEMVNQKDILEWAEAVGVDTSSQSNSDKSTLFDFVDRGRPPNSRGCLEWYAAREKEKDNQIWRQAKEAKREDGGVVTSEGMGEGGGASRSSAAVGVEKRLTSKNQVRQWLARGFRCVFDGRKKQSRLSRYGSSSHRRLQVNHALVASVLGEIDGEQGEENAGGLGLGSIVMFWEEEQGGDVGYGMVVALPGSALVVSAQTLQSTKKKDAVTVRPLVKSLETEDGDYYSIELKLTCILPRSIVLHFPPACKLLPADDDDGQQGCGLARGVAGDEGEDEPRDEPENDWWEDLGDELGRPDDGLFMEIFISAESKDEHLMRRERAGEVERERITAATTRRHASQSQGVHHGYSYE